MLIVQHTLEERDPMTERVPYRFKWNSTVDSSTNDSYVCATDKHLELEGHFFQARI